MLTMTACTKDFEEINVNPRVPSKVPNDYLLSQSMLLLTGSAGDPGYKSWRANFIYAACMMQQMASVEVTFYRGTVYTFQGDLSAAYYESSYPNSIKNLVNLIELASEDPNEVNILSMARILRVIEMANLTDIYGDVPYFEAGRGFIDNVFSPQFDNQKDIYLDMLKELDEAGSALSESAKLPGDGGDADFVYFGDLDKWRRAANTYMLRLAMRMQKADPETAKTWVAKAISKGIMQSNDDTFAMHFSNTGAGNNSNSNSWNLGVGRGIATSDNIQWAATFIDMMKERNDPRLSSISALKNDDRTPENQRGIPSGTDATALNSLPFTELADYSRAAPNMYALDVPQILLTYAESQLLLAEAIERGWASSGSAADAFMKAQVAGAMQVNAMGGTVSQEQAMAYAEGNAYPESGSLDEKVKAIQTELYLVNGSVLNHIEAWADWRRTGYPTLIPVNYPGNETNGTIPRRLRYPQSEYGVNPHLDEAISRQGADSFTTRMWWDK